MNSTPRSPRVAIVHDWLPLYGGAERVLEQMIHVFPDADIFTMIDSIPKEKRGFLQGRHVNTSVIQNLPWGRSRYRWYLPLMPFAVEQFDMSVYDIIISSSYAVAKGVLTGPNQLHICYCHSPIRYGWDLQHEYLLEAGFNKGLSSWLMRLALHYIRLWDTRTANGVDHFLANSRYIARRIRKAYRRTASVIHPPVTTENFSVETKKDDYYLTASRFVPYKKISLVVEAFAQMPGRRLRVIGDGPDWKKIAAKATSNVELLGCATNEELRDQMQRARAFVFAAQEDFGVLPVEAQACGTPVIAYGKGGATETVIDGTTGILFEWQTVESLCEAVQEFERRSFDPLRLRANAERFSVERFRSEFGDFVKLAWAGFFMDMEGGSPPGINGPESEGPTRFTPDEPGR